MVTSFMILELARTRGSGDGDLVALFAVQDGAPDRRRRGDHALLTVGILGMTSW